MLKLGEKIPALPHNLVQVVQPAGGAHNNRNMVLEAVINVVDDAVRS
jgi:hypothetical protein